LLQHRRLHPQLIARHDDAPQPASKAAGENRKTPPDHFV
jgi:hypothetical protein